MDPFGHNPKADQKEIRNGVLETKFPFDKKIALDATFKTTKELKHQKKNNNNNIKYLED